MAVKKPIVMTNGELEQLQAGDYLQSTDTVTMTNSNANAVTLGQPVYVSGNDTVDLAQANAPATKNVFGLVVDTTVNAGDPAGIQTDGLFASANWTAVTGSANLTAGAEYYLDAANAGKLTVTPPSAGGDYVAPVGEGVSATEIEINIERTVKL